MFYIVELEDIVGIPPRLFGADLNSVLKDILNEDKIGKVDKEIGVVLGVVKINKIGSARVVPGDSSAYVDVEYSLLVFKPELQNVYEGQIKEVAEFGAFIGLGPFDALIHVSQLMNDFVNFDAKNKIFVGKESNNILGLNDTVYARVVSVSYKSNSIQSKIGLTMRQNGLGKLEWIEKQQLEAESTESKKEKVAKESKGKVQTEKSKKGKK